MVLVASTLFTKRSAFAALAVASVLLLSTGCAPEFATGGSSGGSESGSTSDSDGSGKDGDNDGKDGDGEGSATGTLTGKECLPGNWLADNEVFEGFMNSVSGEVSVKTTGRVILTLGADGSTQTNYDRWNHDMTVNGGSSVVERHGVDKGTFSVTNSGAMTMTDTSIGSVTTMTVNASGQLIKQTVEPEPSAFNQGDFTCTGDRLEIEVDGYTLLMHREH
ncbi:MAG: hypothetical protein IT190_01290 [Microbacteriaceae bacterium]|nr:hypothetical protein [Microbacteriaceae bacterium]